MKEEILNKKKQELEKLDEKIAEMQAKKKQYREVFQKRNARKEPND